MIFDAPTIFAVIFAYFVALSMVWFYITRSYPNLSSAYYWMYSSYAAAAAAALSLFRSSEQPLLPFVVGNGLLILAACLSWMGIRRFYKRPIPWRASLALTGLSTAAFAAFTYLRDDMSARIVVYSITQSIVLASAALDLLRHKGRKAHGARLAAGVMILVIVVHVVRSAASLMTVGGDVSVTEYNNFQAGILIVMIFAAMAWNFGFLLMAIDRLRAEVVDLALVDDLTGAANRRRLFVRLAEECRVSERNSEPFSLMLLDLDNFKLINDTHGHAAGDECLRMFTRAIEARLRPGDLLTRAGGDEFCVILPATTLREAAALARKLVETCRALEVTWQGKSILVSASIGVAQWSRHVNNCPEKLLAAADEALYDAKNGGRNQVALSQHPPATLRRSA